MADVGTVGLVSDFNASVIEEFRANGGKVAVFGDTRLVILHTVGARSGQVRPVPLATLHADGRTFVFASAAGAQHHPDWYHNLRANPRIDVEMADDTGTIETARARMRELPDPERAERLAQQAALVPRFGEYVTSAAPREIPVFEIEGLDAEG